MKPTLFFLTLFMFSVQAFSQNAEGDELIENYNASNDFTEKAKLAMQISHHFLYINSDQSEDYANKALNHAKSTGNKALMAEANDAKASYFSAVGNFKGSVALYMQSLFYYESQNLYKEIASTSNNIANAFLGIDNEIKAEEYYNRSYQAALIAADSNAIAVPLVGLAILYANQGNLEKALSNTLEAVPLFEGIGRLDGLTVCYVNAATYMHDLDRKEEAFAYMTLAEDVNLKLNNKYFEGSILSNKGSWALEEERYAEAKELCLQGLESLKEINSVPDIMDSYLKLADIHSALNEHDQAFQYMNSYVQMKDSLDQVNQTEIMEEMSAKYDKAIDEKEIANLRLSSNVAQLENRKNKYIIGVSLAGTLGLLILVLVAYRAYKQKKHVAQVLQLKNDIIQYKNSEILASIEYAKHIQDAIIPNEEILKNELNDFFVYYKPKDIVAGDFYWLQPIGNKLLFAVADCTGHGVPGAMVSVVCNNALNRVVKDLGCYDPGEILYETRDIILETFGQGDQDVKDGMDISLFCYDRDNRELKWAGANNPLWIYRKEDQSLEEIKGDKQPVGFYLQKKPYTEHKVTLRKGDTLYLFSDGYADQFGGDKLRKYKSVNLKKFISKIAGNTLGEQHNLLAEEFDKWKGANEQIDDVCFVGIRV